MKINCRNCSKEITTFDKRQKYCSPECFRTRNQNKETRICFGECGEEKELTEENFFKRKNKFIARCKPCHRKYIREYRKRVYLSPKQIESDERHKSKNFGLTSKQKWRIKSTFGLTAEKYGELLTKQNGVCAICKNECTAHTRLAVDHNHITGEVRGLLCLKCNTSFEWVEKYLSGYMEYINKNKQEKK